MGDKIIFDGRSVKGNICYSALTVILPEIFAMRFEAKFPWAADEDVICNACPDAENPVLFEIHRIGKLRSPINSRH